MSGKKQNPTDVSSFEIIAVADLNVHPAALKAFETFSNITHTLHDLTFLTASDVHTLVRAHPISTVRTKSGGLVVIAGFRSLMIVRACIHDDEIEVVVRPSMTAKGVSSIVFASLVTAPLAFSIGRSTSAVSSWRESLEAIRFAAGANDAELSGLKSRNGLAKATNVTRSRLPNSVAKVSA